MEDDHIVHRCTCQQHRLHVISMTCQSDYLKFKKKHNRVRGSGIRFQRLSACVT